MKELPSVYKEMSTQDLEAARELLKQSISEADSLRMLIFREIKHRERGRSSEPTNPQQTNPLAVVILNLLRKTHDAQMLLIRLAAAYGPLKQTTTEITG